MSGLGYNRSHIRSMAQYSTKMIFAVLDVSLIMGLNIGETDKVFYINISKHHKIQHINLMLLKETALREVIENCSNPVAVFLPNYPLNKQQLDVVTSEVRTLLF